MPYDIKIWKNGDLITKESMNNIENGIYTAHDEIETLKNNTSSGTGITPEQAQQLNTAYTHSQSAHVQASDIPTKTSQLTNDNNFASETFVTNKIDEASLSGGEVDLSGYVTKDTGNANQITFNDGETFQAKLDSGTLKGKKGDKGDTGAQGPQGETGPQGIAGNDGKTPNIAIGTVTTLEPGTNATASITGTTPNLTLNLGIPKGDTSASGNSHTHSNKDALDTITTDKISNWDKSIPFENAYTSDCDLWVSNGYIKTSNETNNLPSVCTGSGKWGVLFYISENVANRTGTQMYFPIDGTYAGRVFTRTLMHGIPTKWNMLAVFDDTLVTNSISSNTLTLTTDKLQYTTMATGTTIALPTVTSHTVIHLYFTTGDTAPTVTFPSVAWQKTPSINANKKYEFIFTYVNSTVGWLGGYVEYSL